MKPRLPARPIIFAALLAIAAAMPVGTSALSGAPGARQQLPKAATCPAGSSLARVALYGQTFEAGVPGRGDTPTVIVQHQDRGTNVGNYVPILACVAYWTKAEQDARNAGLSIPPANWQQPR